MIPIPGIAKPDPATLALLDECKAFNNPVKARTTIIKNQIQEGISTLRSITSGNSGQSSKTQKFLKSVGWTKDHLDKVENVLGKYLGTMDLIQNFSVEQIKDMPVIVGALNQYVTDRNILGCSLSNEVFSFLNGHGAELLRGMGVNVDELVKFGNKFRDFITASTKDFNEAVTRFKNWIGKANDFLNRISDLATNWRSEVEAAIRANLEKIEEIMRGNLNSYLARILPTWLGNSCIGQAIGPAISGQMRSAINRFHL